MTTSVPDVNHQARRIRKFTHAKRPSRAYAKQSVVFSTKFRANDEMVNLFAHKSAAERYARGRPYFHATVIRRIKERLSLNSPFQRALDVGCGTGLSTIAVKEIAAWVMGADSSAEMIYLAPKASAVEYQVANAELLPFRDLVFDLVTVSQAIHWFGKVSFLQETRRVTRSEGWLIVYDNYFAGQRQWRVRCLASGIVPETISEPAASVGGLHCRGCRAGRLSSDRPRSTPKYDQLLSRWVN